MIQKMLHVIQKVVTPYLFLYIILFFQSSLYATTYNLSWGDYPPCSTSWSKSGSTYTCISNGRVTLASGDRITSYSNASIWASNGFTISGNNTVGTSTNSITLVSSYGTIDISNATIYGSLQSTSGDITLSSSTLTGNITSNGTTNLTNSIIGGNVSSQNGITTNNTDIDGTVTSSNGNVVLVGGTIYGKVTTSSNTITATGTNLLGGATAQSGISISDGTISGAFSLTSNNTFSLTNVIMPSGSISSAQNIVISNSNLGSASSPIAVQSNGTITVENYSTVYGNMTAAVWGTNVTIIKDSTSTIIGTCSPNYGSPCSSGVNVGERNFALRNPLNTRNLKGGLKVIGNTVLCARNYSGNCYDYTGNDSNSELNLKYIDVNTTDSRTYNNSSSAELSIPSSATIKWAALYTQGYLNGTNPTTIGNAIKEAVYVTIPSIGTIASAPEVIDIYPNYDLSAPYKHDGYTYDTYAPIPSLTGKTGASVNGWITGANIKANTGTEDSGVGNFGAWTLVVVYEDLNATLKNISVFDGYKKVDSRSTATATVDIPISGFLTPTHGVVNSTLSLFVGEGDESITGDKLYARNLSNNFISINNTNAFYSGMSGFTANPSYTNNQGIDIQNHQIGVDGNTSHPQIIGNGQKNTIVRLSSSQDIYFPSMVAFSTELYIPDVCYEENITKNGTVPTQIYAGDILDFEVLISNKSAEPAQKISIKRIFNDDFEYERSSTYVKSGSVFQPKTDIAGDDIVTYTENTNSLVLNLGTGANATNGGTIIKDQNETFRYQFVPQEDGNLTNEYMVTYRDDSNISGTGSVVYSDVPIGKCSDRSITSTVIPILPAGKVRIVESGKNWNDNSGRLFTKIVNKPTMYDILFATNDTGSTLTTGKIKKLEILNIENQSSPVVVVTPMNALTTITQRYPISITHLSAYKRLQFRITLEDNSVATSNDFAVRPASLSGVLSDFWAGESLTLTPGGISAMDNNGNASNLYTQTLNTTNISNISINPLKTCMSNTSLALIDTFTASLTNGQSTSVSAIFKDIADGLILILKDSSWVSSSDDVINGDCIVNSGSNVANASGLFGCNLEGNITVSIKPYEIEVTDANFTASTGQNWLYDANVSDMFVTAHATVQANNMQHVEVLNFTNACYAQPVDLTFLYDVNNTNANTNLSYVAVNGGMVSPSKLFSDLNKTITIPTALFTTAHASADYRFNVDRAYNVPLSPIDMALREVQVALPAVSKIVTNRTAGIGQHFYYGRVKTKDVVTDKTLVPHLLHVEVYSPTIAPNGFYQSSLNWYINASDDGTTGFVDGNFSGNRGFINNQPSTSIAVTGSGVLTDGILRFNINNLLGEQTSTVHVDVPYWLWNSNIGDYNNSAGSTCANHPCFNYKYSRDVDAIGIRSGTPSGSTIGKDYNASYQKTGVKTFR